MEGSVTTVVTTYLATEDQLCWIPNNQQNVATVTQGKRTQFMSTRLFPRQEHVYAFPTRLGWCQTLGIRWMECFLQKGRVKSHKFTVATSNGLLSLTTLMR
jgi:hypothetical protein